MRSACFVQEILARDLFHYRRTRWSNRNLLGSQLSRHDRCRFRLHMRREAEEAVATRTMRRSMSHLARCIADPRTDLRFAYRGHSDRRRERRSLEPESSKMIGIAHIRCERFHRWGVGARETYRMRIRSTYRPDLCIDHSRTDWTLDCRGRWDKRLSEEVGA